MTELFRIEGIIERRLVYGDVLTKVVVFQYDTIEQLDKRLKKKITVATSAGNFEMEQRALIGALKLDASPIGFWIDLNDLKKLVVGG